MQELLYWTLATKYTDKKRDKTYPGKTKVFTLGADKIRMEVSDPFGFVNIGLLKINRDQMYLKLINGSEYKGLLQEEKIKKFLKIDINPKDLVSIFTQKGFEDEHWNCAVGDNNLLRECFSESQNIKIVWTGNMSQVGTEVILSHPLSRLIFRVRGFRSSDQVQEELFEI